MNGLMHVHDGHNIVFITVKHTESDLKCTQTSFCYSGTSEQRTHWEQYYKFTYFVLHREVVVFLHDVRNVLKLASYRGCILGPQPVHVSCKDVLYHVLVSEGPLLEVSLYVITTEHTNM